MMKQVDRLPTVAHEHPRRVSQGQVCDYTRWFVTRVQRAFKSMSMGKKSTEMVELSKNGETIGKMVITRVPGRKLLVEASLNGDTTIRIIGEVKNHNFTELPEGGFKSLKVQLLESPHVVQRWLDIEKGADGLK